MMIDSRDEYLDGLEEDMCNRDDKLSVWAMEISENGFIVIKVMLELFL